MSNKNKQDDRSLQVQKEALTLKSNIKESLTSLINNAKISKTIIATKGMEERQLICQAVKKQEQGKEEPESGDPLRTVTTKLREIELILNILSSPSPPTAASHVNSIDLSAIYLIAIEKISEKPAMINLISFGNTTAYAPFAKESKEEQENIKTKILNRLENVVTAAQESLNKLNDLIEKEEQNSEEKPKHELYNYNCKLLNRCMNFFRFFTPSAAVLSTNNENDTHPKPKPL
jgi:hypothetical protein